jgi:hypothetical protein
MNTRRILLVSICALLSAFALRITVRSMREIAPITARSVMPNGLVPAAARALRPNYPYSVIAGGAYSPAELRFANAKDGVVREHYSDFDLRAVRLVTLASDRYQYVSFRMKNQVFWTRKRLRIPRGEVLLTDGRNYARTRCGNRLSSVAQGPTTALQPPEAQLSTPIPTSFAPAAPLGELAQQFPLLPNEAPRLAPYLPAPEASLGSPEVWSPASGWMPAVGPIAPGAFPPQNASSPQQQLKPPVNLTAFPETPAKADVPEPASLLLFGIGLCISGWFLGRMARRNRGARRASTASEK